ncbi:MFS transporter [Lamprobacter modestohalophilus]|uniref:AmpG family muropeptide MFS transporter n=1 Tax=Lamprobacter modestohalophilus TaxID=1064514 RepID=UPI002ADEC146|nr:MFS transporter [Lamprobacter modestohalophilus]MEA1050864.1 MFS transporter [Lamprobacter modestohalophilus]
MTTSKTSASLSTTTSASSATAGEGRQGWRKVLSALRDRRVLTMLFLGFAAGIPLLLIFSSLSLWLREAGVERSAVTFFSWAALGYSFKFIWAPLVDRLPLPWLTRRLGRRRGWLLLSQIAIITAIALMASVDPAQGDHSLVLMALAAVMLGFSAATQDICIDAYRIEIAPPAMQGMLSAAYIAGYRIGMVTSGAGALFLAAMFMSSMEQYSYEAWRLTYLIMAATMLIGVATTLLVREPEVERLDAYHYGPMDYARLVLVFLLAVVAFAGTFFFTSSTVAALKQATGGGPFGAFLLETLHFALALGIAGLVGWALVRVGAVNREMARQTWVAPVLDFFRRYGLQTALLLLALIGLYRISDIVLGVIANVFYQDLGFTKPEIAQAVKTFGVVVSIAGGFIGGLMATRFGVMRILMLGAVLSALTNLIFVALAYVGHSLPLLYLTVAADNLAAGLASAAFVAFLSSLTSVSFTAVQYAIFSSLMTLLPKVIGGYSGSIVDGIGYPGFFIFTTLIGVPVLVLVWLAGRRLALREQPG